MRWGLSDSPFRVLFVGRLEAEKGVEVALEAIKLLVSSKGTQAIQASFVGAGRPEYVQFLRNKITQYGIRQASLAWKDP